MFQELIYAMLGPWSKTAIEWAIANPLPVGIVSTTLLVIWLSGKYQLDRVEKKTKEYALNAAKEVLERNPDIDIEDLYDRIYPGWATMVTNTARFVPHRWELWPVPTDPEKVKDQIEFNPEWLSTYLAENGLATEPEAVSEQKQP